jgi:hypothetical protein
MRIGKGVLEPASQELKAGQASVILLYLPSRLWYERDIFGVLFVTLVIVIQSEEIGIAAPYRCRCPFGLTHSLRGHGTTTHPRHNAVNYSLYVLSQTVIFGARTSIS